MKENKVRENKIKIGDYTKANTAAWFWDWLKEIAFYAIDNYNKIFGNYFCKYWHSLGLTN